MNLAPYVKPKGHPRSCHGRCVACGSKVRTFPCPSPKCNRIYCYDDCLPRHHFFEHVVRPRKKMRSALEAEGIL